MVFYVWYCIWNWFFDWSLFVWIESEIVDWVFGLCWNVWSWECFFVVYLGYVFCYFERIGRIGSLDYWVWCGGSVVGWVWFFVFVGIKLFCWVWWYLC